MPFVTVATSVAPLSGTALTLFSAGDELLEYGLDGSTKLRVLDENGNIVVTEFTPGIFLTSPTLLANGDIVGINGSGVLRFDQTGAVIDQSVAFTPGPGRATELANGNILITYNDGNGDLRGQLLTSTLDLIGTNFGLATDTSYTAEVSALAGGGFAIVSDGSPALVQAFAANGAPASPAVNMGSPYISMEIQALSDGGYVFAGTTLHTVGIGGVVYTSSLQFFNADGSARTAQIFLSSASESVNVAALDDGLLVVNLEGSRSQLYHESGRALGDPIATPFFGMEDGMEGIDADTFASHGRLTLGGPTELIFWSVDRPNILIGDATSETFDGNGATDRIMAGFGGDDVFDVDSAGDIVHEWAGEGNDTVIASVSYQLRAGVEVELLRTDNDAGVTALNLGGNALAQTIRGNAGANQLTGGGGGDTLIGLGGNDFYFVSSAADVVQETAGNGTDRIFASASYTLAAGVEVEMMTTALATGTAAINLTGNALVQAIHGNAGANQLTSGGGADSLVGLGGNDFYFLSDGHENVFESVGGGADRIFTSQDYHLRAGSEVEVISTDLYAGTAAIDIIGNEFAQTIYGNAGANQLTGGGGGDVLFGLGGDDWYFVNHSGDVVNEAAAGGNDRIFSSVSFTLSPGSQVEIMSTNLHTGTTAINLSGNALSQAIYGNAGANQLDGGAGKDVLVGNGGADTFMFSTALNTAPGAAFAALAATANVDRIDGLGADDKIGLSASLFGLPAGALAPGAFALGATATEADDRILYNQATGALLFDADGSGAGAAQLFAYVSGAPSLDASYFIVG